MVKRTFPNPDKLTRAGVILQSMGVLALGLATVMPKALLELFTSKEILHDAERRLHESDLSGELNQLTGRLDAGTDPFGWYDD